MLLIHREKTGRYLYRKPGNFRDDLNFRFFRDDFKIANFLKL